MNSSIQDDAIEVILDSKGYYHIYCLRHWNWRLGGLWNFVLTYMCKSYVCQIYIILIKNGFIPLFHFRAVMIFIII